MVEPLPPPLVEDAAEPAGSSDEPGPVVILAYDGLAADEASVLIEILTAADLDVTIASVLAAPVTSYNGKVVVTRPAADIERCSALLVPGGLGVRTTAENPAVLRAIAELSTKARWLGATSTGSVLLAAAGIIDGARVTTHWLAGDLITDRGLELSEEPLVEWGRLLTASGIVGTADLSFRLVGALRGHQAEARIRAVFVPPPADADPRYQRSSRRWWRRLTELGRGRADRSSRKQVVDEERVLSLMDPEGRADVIVLDLTNDKP
ncbi:MAG: DJ-1/PfpI family protein [Acidimicrobiia bacterium]|nr:DJ-1/PfpI family protein [Acidimicrobiia bacterium]